MSNIRCRVIGGIAWTYAERILAQLISLVVTVILARIISPREYGIISIITIFISFADTFAVNGFGAALIQKKDADHLDFSSVFLFNIFFSMGIYAIFWFAAPYIASFYAMDELMPTLRVMSVRIPIAAINSVQQAYVSKRMEFKKFFWATLGGTLISAAVGIIMANKGFGVWALVAQYLSNTIIDTVVLWLTVGWRPKWEFSWLRVKGLVSFGWKILASSLMINVYGNLKNLVIGKKYSSEDLAYSTKGEQFPGLIAVNINTSITKVLFPVLAECQEERDSVKRITKRAICVGTYLLSPVLLGFAAISPTFVKLVLTEKWMPVIPFLVISCFIQLFQPIQTASIQAMKALGKSGIYLRLEIWKKIFDFLVLGITVFLFHSVESIILGTLICEVFSTLMNFPVNKKILVYGYKEQVADFSLSILPSVFMSAAVWYIGRYFHTLFLKVSIQVITGGLMFIVFSAVTGNPNYRYLVKIAKGRK